MKYFHKTIASATIAITATLSICSVSAEAARFNIGTNFTGVTQSIPSSISGAVGTNQIVEFTNGAFTVYDKTTGTPLQQLSDMQFWTGIAGIEANNLSYKPRVVYDVATGRWFAAEIESFSTYDWESDVTTVTNNFLLAVSNSSNPTAGWTGFKINMPATVSNTSTSSPITANWGDWEIIDYDRPEPDRLATYPTLGLDADGVYLSSNRVDGLGSGKSVSLASIPKADLLSPTPTVANAKIFGNLDNSQYGFSIQPALDFGASDNSAALLGINHDITTYFRVRPVGRTSNLIQRSNILNSGNSLASISPGVDIQVDNYSPPYWANQPNLINSFSRLPNSSTPFVSSLPTIEVTQDPIGRGPTLVLPNNSSARFVSSLPTIEVPDNSPPPPFSRIADLDTRLSSNVFEVGNSLWVTHNIAVQAGDGLLPRSGIRWYEIDERTNAVLQSGTISDRDYDYFLPSIAANQFGDVVIGFNRSGGISIDGTGKNEFVSSYAVLGQTTNGVTTFGNPLLLKAGLDRYTPEINPAFGLQPWGSFSATVVDPSDPFSFWTFQAFANKSNPNLGSIWSSQITQVKVDPSELLSFSNSQISQAKVARSVPEPGSVFGLLAFGVLGVGSVLKHNIKTGFTQRQ